MSAFDDGVLYGVSASHTAESTAWMSFLTEEHLSTVQPSYSENSVCFPSCFFFFFQKMGGLWAPTEHGSVSWSCFNQENPRGSLESISFLPTLRPPLRLPAGLKFVLHRMAPDYV